MPHLPRITGKKGTVPIWGLSLFQDWTVKGMKIPDKVGRTVIVGIYYKKILTLKI